IILYFVYRYLCSSSYMSSCVKIYFCSIELGPEDITTSSGYFQMGNVFFEMKDYENGLTMYEKVVEIWQTHLTSALSNTTSDHLTDSFIGNTCYSSLLFFRVGFNNII